MKLLGIDYGSKRVGIAVSDDRGAMAFPVTTLLNTDDLMKEIISILKEEDVKEIVIGESKDFKGVPNAIMEEINPFKALLEKETGLPVHFEPEFMTSEAAVRFQGRSEHTDASAAALILQSFLDRK
jgi:putative holliday junction resolvase